MIRFFKSSDPYQNIYLRKNRVEGAYDSFNHYRDVIFRLTREDFMRPLREGFQNFITEKPGRAVLENCTYFISEIQLQLEFFKRQKNY